MLINPHQYLVDPKALTCTGKDQQFLCKKIHVNGFQQPKPNTKANCVNSSASLLISLDNSRLALGRNGAGVKTASVNNSPETQIQNPILLTFSAIGSKFHTSTFFSNPFYRT